MGLPLSPSVLAPRALLLIGILALPAVSVQAETWSAGDVEAAERYREQERERAARYRTALESAPRREATPSARGSAKPTSAPATTLGDRLVARFADWLRAWMGAWLADLVEAAERWWLAQLESLAKRFEKEPARTELHGAERAPLTDWIAREQERARHLLEGGDATNAPIDPAADREWAEREAVRARAWARRALERERGPAPWEERWREVESWEAIERERAQRQLESAREWQAEERERLEAP